MTQVRLGKTRELVEGWRGRVPYVLAVAERVMCRSEQCPVHAAPQESATTPDTTKRAALQPEAYARLAHGNSMSSLIHCIYTSAAARALSTPEISELLHKAREKNQRLGLTGMLLYADASFFQVLEGEEQVVNALYARIQQDKRHTRVTKVISEAIPKRSFDAWTMGFSAATREELAGISGLNDFFRKAHCFDTIDAGRAKKLLEAFAEGRWRQTLADNG